MLSDSGRPEWSTLTPSSPPPLAGLLFRFSFPSLSCHSRAIGADMAARALLSLNLLHDARVCVFVLCVCVCERERERGSVYVCVCVCVSVCVSE